MRRLILVIGFLLIMTGVVMAQEFTPPMVLLNAVTSTGYGSEVNFGIHSGKYSCTVVLGGTAPTNVVVQLHLADSTGIYDTTNYDAQQTVTSSPWKFYVVNKGGKYIKGNYVSKSGGDATTSVTLTCVAGGN